MSQSICGPGSGNPNWNCIENTPGAQVLATLYSLDDNGQLQSTSANGIIASVVSYGFTVATIDCKQNFIASQTIALNCNNAVIGAKVAVNANCVACKAAMQDILDSRQSLETDAHAQNPNYTIQIPNPVIVQQFQGVDGSYSSGVCDWVCEQCVVKDVEQKLSMNINVNCDTNTNSFISAFTSGMSTQAEYELTKQSSSLSNAGYDLNAPSSNGNSPITNLAIQMSDSIVSMTKNVSLNSLQQQALAIQSTQIDPDSTSVVISHLLQTISIDMFASLASSTYNDTTMQNAINYEILQKQIQIETSFSTLLQQLEASTVTMKGLVLTLVGEILIAILSLLLTAVIIFVFYVRFIMAQTFL